MNKALEQAMLQAAIFEAAIAIAVLIVLFGVTYYVIKAGVRDGIAEALPRVRQPQRQTAPPGYEWRLMKIDATTEDMRAD